VAFSLVIFVLNELGLYARLLSGTLDRLYLNISIIIRGVLNHVTSVETGDCAVDAACHAPINIVLRMNTTQIEKRRREGGIGIGGVKDGRRD